MTDIADLSIEEWLGLFNDESVFKPENMLILHRFMDMGGAATCTQLANRYGKSWAYYNTMCPKLAKRIADKKQIVLEKKADGSEVRWPVLFIGSNVTSDENIDGSFLWTLKPNLKAALEKVDLSIYEPLYEQNADLVQNLDELRKNIERYENLKNSENFDSAQLKDVMRGSENFLRYIKDGKVCFVNSKLIGYRIHENLFARRGIYGDGRETNQRLNELLGPKQKNSACEMELKAFWEENAYGLFTEKNRYFWNFDGNKRTANMQYDEMKSLLQMKKNVILQGAPGTGKTYATAALALSILGITDVDFSDHNAVMQRYNSLLIKFDDDGNICNDGQIGFVTFHQSMDYEDFVEGIKPIVGKVSGNVSYKVLPGIFKSLCKETKNVLENNFELAYGKFITKLKENNFIEKNRYYELKTPTGSTFGVSLNSKNNLTLWTGKDSALTEQGTLTKDNLSKQLRGQSIFDGWSGYFEGVIAELRKTEYGLSLSKKSKDTNYVLIIDEINRGNVSRIFGELISLLEADKRLGGSHPLEVTLPYSKETFSIPSNLYIIGTMNTTDRSVGSIDYAVRRRFAFYTLKANVDALKAFYVGKNVDLKNKAVDWFNKTSSFIELNKATSDIKFEDLMIGHSYFMAESLNDLELKWKYEVLPLLEEYKKDGLLKHSAKIEDVLA